MSFGRPADATRRHNNLAVIALLAAQSLANHLVAMAAPDASAAFDLQHRKSNHWAWRPIATPAVPRLRREEGAISTIDALVLSTLQEAGLERAAPADKRALIRRATFDLIGLPPTPAEVEAFQADSSPGAFAAVVDRLLASPHFGERWARHWLDVVRYSETLGHEFDYPLVDAWRYRDYVIRALNADVPYDQFVREHIAGDLLDPPRLHDTEGYNESIIATAFWYMGEATHAPVDSRADQATRIENQVDVLSKAFFGLTVACARCHDHKFDAISTEDYYSLAGYVASSHQQSALLDPGGKIEAGAQRLAELQQRGRKAWRAMPLRIGAEAADHFARCLLAVRAARDASEAALRDDIARHDRIDSRLLDRFVAASADADGEPGDPLFAWKILTDSADADDSFEARRHALAADVEEQNDQAAAVRRDQHVFEDFSGGLEHWFRSGWAFGSNCTACGDWMAGPEDLALLPAGMAHSGRLGAKLQGVIRSPKFTIEKPYIFYRLTGRNGQVRVIVDGYTLDNFSPQLFEGLSFEVNTEGATRWHVQDVARHVGHRAHIELVDSGEGFIAVDEIRFAGTAATEPPSDALTALILSQPGVASVESLAEAYGIVWAQSLAEWRDGRPTAGAEFVRWALSNDLTPEHPDLQHELAETAKQAAAIDGALPDPAKVVAIADGSGEDQRVHVGGSYNTLGEVAPRRFLEAIAGPRQPAPQHGSGRMELASRMLSSDNPFTARVMANRIWAHLFGRGIVATVDNFGVLGERPTHPELLDYLATRFRDGGWSIKRVIREIMLSEAYQLASVNDPISDERDPLNQLVHRANVRRLEGEAIRDALLAVSGSLDAAQFGPSVPIHLTPFMEGRGRPKESGPLDGRGRRSVYIEVRRNFLSPLMLAFDTPPPASCVGQRNNSNVPAQALTLMNDPFLAQQCNRWAERVLAGPKQGTDDRVTELYLTAFGRPPSSDELTAAREFVVEQAGLYGAKFDDVRVWADLCHVLVNVKEFIFID